MTIYLLETYVKSHKIYKEGPYENTSGYIIFLDNKTKRVYDNIFHLSHLNKTKHRSLKSYMKSLNIDFERMKDIFKEFEVNLTKIGEL